MALDAERETAEVEVSFLLVQADPESCGLTQALGAMFQRIFVVIDRFDLAGKGTDLTGITHDDSLRVPVGADVTVKRPSLPVIQSEALDFEVFRNCWSPTSHGTLASCFQPVSALIMYRLTRRFGVTSRPCANDT
jgi:hypothetical protein